MNKSITAIIVVLALVALLGIYYIIKSGPSGAETNTEKTQNENVNTEKTEIKEEPSAQKNEKEEYVITYSDSGFSPETIKIKTGETVTFKNQSSNLLWPASAMHPTHIVYSGTALSEHCPDTVNTAFDACKEVPQNEEWSFKFEKVGSWKYHNHLNATRRGTVVVE